MLITNKQTINEASLGRVYQHLGKDCMLFISADRGENSKAENKKNFNILKKAIYTANFGYNRLKGGYYEQDAETGETKEITDENSLVVYAPPEEGDTLLELGKKLGKKFKQDSIMFVDAKGKAKWVATRPDNFLEIPMYGEKPLGEWSTAKISKYYSKIGKKKFTFLEVGQEHEPVKKQFNESIARDFRNTVVSEEDWLNVWADRWKH